MKFSRNVDKNNWHKDYESISVVIRVTVWMQEIFKGFLIISLASHILNVSPWQRYRFSKCSCY